MIRRLLGYAGAAAIMGCGLLIYSHPVFAVTQTQTVIGYAIPNANGLSAGLIPFILPILVTGLFVGLTKFIGLDGSMNSFVIKMGLLIGSLLGMLSLTTANATLIPFAFPFIAAVYLITYLWKGV